METGRSVQFDTAVIGGGITGMSLSWFLAEEGVSVLCLDHGRDSGSTANAGSMHVQMQSRIATFYPDRIDELERTLWLYPLAVEFWKELADKLEEDVELRMTGGLMVAEDDEQMRSLERKSARENRNGVETSLLDRDELARVAPYLADSFVGACYCSLEGKVNPLLANVAIERLAREAGATIRRETDVTGIERHASTFEIRSNAGRFTAQRVVIAAGARSGELAETLDCPMAVHAEPLHMNVTNPAPRTIEHLVQHAARPVTLKQLQSGHVVIGGGWPARAGETPQVLLDSVMGNLELAGHMVPAIKGLQLLRTWAGINPVTDLLSVLGSFKKVPDLFIALPGDAGYTLGPVCARLLADRLLGRPAEYPLDDFSPDRFAGLP
jgi:glycine/D-amino acid oxidase-like deaminating enzyme